MVSDRKNLFPLLASGPRPRSTSAIFLHLRQRVGFDFGACDVNGIVIAIRQEHRLHGFCGFCNWRLNPSLAHCSVEPGTISEHGGLSVMPATMPRCHCPSPCVLTDRLKVFSVSTSAEQINVRTVRAEQLAARNPFAPTPRAYRHSKPFKICLPYHTRQMTIWARPQDSVILSPGSAYRVPCSYGPSASQMRGVPPGGIMRLRRDIVVVSFSRITFHCSN